MASTLYQEMLEPQARQHIEALQAPEALARWYDEALEVVDAEQARALLRKITQATY